MNAAAKRQRAYVAAGDIEPIGLRVDRGVAIGRAEQAQHRSPLRHRDAADVVDVFECGAASQLYRRIVAQQLIDRVAGKRRIAPQKLQLIGMAVQRQRPLPIRFTVVS